MVLQKRLDVGFNGYQIPAMPRGSRSARGRRRWCRKTAEENQMYAFELLATVARNILLGQENTPGSTSKSPPAKQNEQQLLHKKKPFKVEPSDQGSCDEGTLTWKESPGVSSSGGSHPSAVVVKSDVSGRTGFAEVSKVQNSVAKKVEFPIRSPTHVKKEKGGDGSIEAVSNMFCIENSMDFDTKHPPLVSSDSSVEVHQYRNHRSSPKFKGEVEIMNAVYDDEENSSGCTHPSAINSKHFRSQKIGDRRIKKITASKFWKVGPTLLKDGEFYSNDAGPKPLFRNRKMCCTRRRSQRSSFKRRQLFMRSSVSAGLGDRSEDFYKPFENGSQGGACGFGADLHGAADETWPSMASPNLPSKPEDYKVKLRIKSIKVPELFIEMPETATVGSLKRTVLETVSAMLVNGLRVGVISHGKKVRDDSKTLLQAGIARGDEQLESLGFTLEENPSKAPQHVSGPGDPYLLESPESPQPLARFPAVTASVSSLAIGSNPDGSSVVPPPDHHRDRHWPRPLAVVEPSSPPPEGNHPAPLSKAIVPVQSVGDDQSLALVPSSHRKTKRSEVVQRRIRRPFSVAEVEALVQAVECLGTGRWRDVKIRAFENVKHRTYVDLKDKWKTLVHTARISPQQRRGEPVPQELLDRVLQAHAHWSHQQAKLQGKLPPQQQLLLPPAEQSMFHD